MARQGIFTGTSPNDGTGDSLLSGALKVNQNFTEIYSAFGDGTNLATAGVGGTWSVNSTGIHTTKNVGIGTTNATSVLTVNGSLSVNGISTFTNNVNFVGVATNIFFQQSSTSFKYGDNARSYFGTALDLEIFSDGSFSTIQERSGGSKKLYIVSDDLELRSYTTFEPYLTATANNSVSLFYDSFKKFETLGVGVTITGTTFTNQLNVSGVVTASQINSEVSTLGIVTANELYVSGVSTFVGVTTFINDLYVGGDLYVQDDLVFDEATVHNINVTGLSTLGIVTANELYVSGVSTFVGVTTFINDLYVGGDLYVQGINVTGLSTLGIVTANELYVSGVSTFVGVTTFINDLYVGGDLTVDEATVHNINVTGLSTLGIVTANELYVSGVSTFGIVQVSSGIVSATSGIVTYYGDGSNLTGVSGFDVIQQEVTSQVVYPTLANDIGVSSVGISTTELVFIPSTGNLGIGTTNPQTKLQVGGVLRFNDSNVTIGDTTTGVNLSPNLFQAEGIDNIFIGDSAGSFTTIGRYNNFFGRSAGYSNISGIENNFIGNSAGYSNQAGVSNQFVGSSAGYNNDTGNYNNFLGSSSGYNNTTGSYNIFLGSFTGISQSASYKIIFGSSNSNSYQFDAPVTDKDTQFAVGVRTDVNESKYWLVGNEDFNVGIGTTNPTSKLTVESGDVKVGMNTSQGIILTDADGVAWRLFVNTDGTLGTVLV